ncbi:MAG: ATP cone domain-containing protein [bacterium]|nr:ATP cone domain-containing protein [bacterium]
MSPNTISVLKADGTQENFDQSKLLASLEKSGASKEVATEVAEHVARELVGGITTADIYRHAFSVLHTKQKMASVRYSLRRSLLALGPTGFPFEKFVGEIYKRKGFTVLLDQMVWGRCVDHEMDVIAWNESKLIMAEAKYHHEFAYKSDVKVALYVKARFDDLTLATFTSYGPHRKLDEGWLITNTKFTEKAIRYAECSGVRLLGWNYPEKGNLHDLIEETGVHPVTCLTTLTDKQKQQLMNEGIVLCESIPKEKEKLRSLGFDERLIADATSESGLLCPV